MGDFDKKRAFSIGGVLSGLIGIIAVLANLSEILQFAGCNEKSEKSVTTTSIVETIEKNTKAKETKQAEETIVEEENVAEVVEEIPETEPQQEVIYLNSLKVVEKSMYAYYVENANHSVDTIGNTYLSHTITIGSENWRDDSYITYYLGGKYNTLSGTIAVNDDTYDGETGALSILCDENIVYSTGVIDRMYIPTEFSVNVEGCQWLKISDNKSAVKFIIDNCKLE
ncbi:MAG: NPCBM/NEW2 domain-containing protein [Ruminococcus sp.]|nr:NPCBM/NEW2 domain-containing protein [Ruminococcus sp.]